MSASIDDLFAYLADLGIETRTIEHPPVFTVEEARTLRGETPGKHTKNLFLRDNKRNYFLVTLEDAALVDLKRLRPVIGAKGGLSFGSAEALEDHLGVKPGSVTLFAALNDKAGAVTVFIDKTLLDGAVVNCHPLINTRTTAIAPDDLLKFLRATGHEPHLLALDELAQGAEAGSITPG